jgi:hypothetical protein
MSILTARFKHVHKEYYSSDVFSLDIEQSQSHSNITMYLQTPTVNTYAIGETYHILEQTLPSILRATCFNDDKLPFSTEVLQTEIGHLFEHILLEYLCDIKLSHGYKNPIHNGVTRWNWIQDNRGTFHIHIDAGVEDTKLFFEALSLSISLLEEILEYDPFRKDKKKKIQPIPFSYNLN